MASVYCVLLSLILFQSRILSGKKIDDFKLVYKWKQIEYTFRSEEERSQAIANGSFNEGVLYPVDSQYTYNSHTKRERIFISIPRLDPMGYPAALGVVTNKSRNGNPIIDPYPAWSWHLNPAACNYYRIVSVFRMWADECNRLWVIDNGILGIHFICPPQLLAFDLKTDKLLYKYEIPYDQHQNFAWYVTPLVEVESKKNACKNTWVYVADAVGPSLLVYSLKQNTSWRIHDKTFEPDPNYISYTVEGITFEISDGINTLALSPAADGKNKRKLHYHAMSNIKECFAYLKDLKNASNFEVPYGSPQLFHTYKNLRDQQASVEASDRRGNLYFSLLIDDNLVKWDPRTPYIRKNFEVVTNNSLITQFPSGIKILPYKGKYRQAIWMFTTSYQRRAGGVLNGNQTNFRLFVKEL